MTTVSETLHKAADLIEKRGYGDHWGERDTDPLCLEGAIIAALGETHCQFNGLQLTRCPAYRAVAEYVALPEDERLFNWNDLTGSYEDHARIKRTAAAVIEAAKEAAANEVPA